MPWHYREASPSFSWDLFVCGDGGARAVVCVDGVPDGDDGPRQRREHRDEQDPPARDEGLERCLLAVHALEDAERVEIVLSNAHVQSIQAEYK